MAKKVNIVGAKPKRVRVLDKPRRRIEPAELAAQLGAEPAGVWLGKNLDLISLAELGTKLLSRLRSSGGRPALADATEFCRVPLSTEDVKALEEISGQIEQRTGTKPSVGQIVSIIVRDFLKCDSPKLSEAEVTAGKNDPTWFPRLAEIASKASTVQKCASDLETAVKQIQEDVGLGVE